MCRTAEKFSLCARSECSDEDYSSISCTWQMRRKKMRERMNFNPAATPNAHVTRVPCERAHIQYISIHHGLRQTICHLARVGEWGWEVLFMPNLASRRLSFSLGVGAIYVRTLFLSTQPRASNGVSRRLPPFPHSQKQCPKSDPSSLFLFCCATPYKGAHAITQEGRRSQLRIKGNGRDVNARVFPSIQGGLFFKQT